MKKNLIIKWQWCHFIKFYWHELCNTKSSEYTKTQNVTSYEKLQWTILIFNVLCSYEAITWKTFWIHIYVFDRFKKQIWYDIKISMIEKT